MIKPRILLADDHGLVLEGEKTVLPERFEIVGTASDGRRLVEEALRLKPDLIVMDISMPLLSGIEAARRIKEHLPKVKLLFLTMHSERPYLRAALQAGASGYVLKSAEHGELQRAVERVLRGELYISADLAGSWTHLSDPDQVAKSLSLSPREHEVLQLIAEGRSSKEIAGILGVSIKTVTFHRENIKRKLGVKTTAELTRHAIAAGLM